jgi:phage repressor protein C with HTH and peptisase S24 domain
VPLVPRDASWLSFKGRAAAAGTTNGEPLPEGEPDQDEFILVVTGDCLTPRIQPGDYLHMDKHRYARPGSYVSVIIAGERYIKRLVSRNGLWVLESNYGELTLPPDAFALEATMVKRLRDVGEDEP